MATRPVPPEEERLLALRALEILDTPAEEAFDRLTRVGAAAFGVPISLISLVDDRRQWFKSRVGFEFRETHRDISFCARALRASEPLVVPDAAADPRFADNPLVTGQPHIRFYAGAQLRTANEVDLGTFCILDTKPRGLSPEEAILLQDLAATATLLIEQRRMVLDYQAQSEARRVAEQRMRTAKEEAEAASAAMRTLFSRVSHDLRTPLAAITGFSELLADGPLTQEQKDDLAEVQGAARKLLGMVDSLLEVARRLEEDGAAEPEASS